MITHHYTNRPHPRI